MAVNTQYIKQFLTDSKVPNITDFKIELFEQFGNNIKAIIRMNNEQFTITVNPDNYINQVEVFRDGKTVVYFNRG